MTGTFRKTPEGLLIRVRLTPNAAKDQIVGVENNADGKPHLKVKVRAAPEKGKANKSLIRFLAKSLGLPKSSFGVISGHTSRAKTLLIAGSQKEIQAKWQKLLAGD